MYCSFAVQRWKKILGWKQLNVRRFETFWFNGSYLFSRKIWTFPSLKTNDPILESRNIAPYKSFSRRKICLESLLQKSKLYHYYSSLSTFCQLVSHWWLVPCTKWLIAKTYLDNHIDQITRPRLLEIINPLTSLLSLASERRWQFSKGKWHIFLKNAWSKNQSGAPIFTPQKNISRMKD